MKTTLFLVCAIVFGFGIVTPAKASFELMLVTDADQNVVHRFDPESGLYLGKFGTGAMLTPSGIALAGNTGNAYVSNYGLRTVQTWNFGSGTLNSEFATVSNPWGIATLSDGNILTGEGSHSRVYTPSGSLLLEIAATNFNAYAVATDGTNLITGDFEIVSKYDPSGVLLSTISTPGKSALSMSLNGDRVYMGGQGFTGKFGRYNSGTMNGYTVTNVSQLSQFYNVEAIGFSHGQSIYVAGRSTSSGNPVTIARYHTVSGNTTGTFGTGIMGRPTSMVVVLAPEPGSMIAIGLGLAGLANRRKNLQK